MHQNPQINWKGSDTVTSQYITWDEAIANLDIISDPTNDETWKYLSQRWDLDINYVLENLDNPWDWNYISRHKYITREIIEANPHCPWTPYIVIHKGCNWEFIKPYIEKEIKNIYHKCDIGYYTNHRGDMDDEKFDEMTKALFKCIGENPYITWDIIRNEELLYSNIQLLSHSKAIMAITGDIMEANPHIHWDPYSVMEKGCNWEFIKPYVMKELDKTHLCCFVPRYYYDDYDELVNNVYNSLAKNPNITWDVISNDVLLYSRLEYLSYSNSITWDIVLDNPFLDWNWTAITKKAEITMEIVKEHLDAPWDWWVISLEKASLHDITEHPEYPWNWDAIYYRGDLTEDFKHANRDKMRKL